MLKSLVCYSCRHLVTLRDIREKDGFCPHCSQPIDIEDYPKDEIIGDADE